MNRILLPLALLSAPLSAQSFEFGIFLGQQSYHGSDFTPVPSIPNTRLKAEVDRRTVTSLRLGYSLFDFGPGSLQATCGYQPETQAVIHNSAPNLSQNLGESTLTEHYWSAGAAFHFGTPVAIGFGLEYRSETLGGGMTGTFTYNRPWARLNAGYVFPASPVKPFIGLEVALPLITKSNVDGSNAETAIQAVAPKMQLGVYTGVRF